MLVVGQLAAQGLSNRRGKQVVRRTKSCSGPGGDCTSEVFFLGALISCAATRSGAVHGDLQSAVHGVNLGRLFHLGGRWLLGREVEHPDTGIGQLRRRAWEKARAGRTCSHNRPLKPALADRAKVEPIFTTQALGAAP